MQQQPSISLNNNNDNLNILVSDQVNNINERCEQETPSSSPSEMILIRCPCHINYPASHWCLQCNKPICVFDFEDDEDYSFDILFF